MYGIRVKYNYYPGTFNTPVDGWLEIEGLTAAWNSKKDAQDYIDYEDRHTYYLDPGEYGRPDMKVRKINKDGKQCTTNYGEEEQNGN